jgi:hypothetical protein
MSCGLAKLDCLFEVTSQRRNRVWCTVFNLTSVKHSWPYLWVEALGSTPGARVQILQSFLFPSTWSFASKQIGRIFKASEWGKKSGVVYSTHFLQFNVHIRQLKGEIRFRLSVPESSLVVVVVVVSFSLFPVMFTTLAHHTSGELLHVSPCFLFILQDEIPHQSD